MAAPTPVTTVQFDGWKGLVRWRAAWGVGDTDFTDSVLVDVSALAPVPPSNALKIRELDVLVNGNFTVNFEWDDVASGTVNTSDAPNLATWVSGDQFNTAWLTNPGITEIKINAVRFTITSIDSATQITLASAPGVQSGVVYDVDEIFEQFINQSDISYQFLRDYTSGPNRGLVPTKTSSTRTGNVGDILLTTSGAASGDELSLILKFERDG